MRILIASVDALPKLGGISLMTHHLANALVDDGHDVICVGPQGTYVPTTFDRRYELLEDWDSDVTKRAGEEGAAQDARIAQLFSTLIRQREVDRVLLLHPFYYGVGALDAASAEGVPLSVYFHGFELRSQLRGQYPSNHARILKDRVVGTLRERVFYLVGGASEILVNSHFTQALFDEFAIKPRVRVTGCGIPLNLLEREEQIVPAYSPEDKRERRFSLGLPDPPCIAYVGRLVPTKGVDRILHLCSRQEELSALIIGDGPDWERLGELCSRLSLDDRIQFAGEVDEETKWRFLRAADYLALLSVPNEERGQVEGFGIALLEGAAAGCIPLSSGTGGMGDVVEPWDTGVVGADLEALGADLEVLQARPALGAALVRHARQQIRDRYNWRAVARSIVAGW